MLGTGPKTLYVCGRHGAAFELREAFKICIVVKIPQGCFKGTVEDTLYLIYAFKYLHAICAIYPLLKAPAEGKRVDPWLNNRPVIVPSWEKLRFSRAHSSILYCLALDEVQMVANRTVSPIILRRANSRTATIYSMMKSSFKSPRMVYDQYATSMQTTSALTKAVRIQSVVAQVLLVVFYPTLACLSLILLTTSACGRIQTNWREEICQLHVQSVPVVTGAMGQS